MNRRNWVNDVKASACWVWKPVKSNSASIILKRYDYVDVRGRSRDYSVQQSPCLTRQNILVQFNQVVSELNNLGKFEGKRDEGYFIGYSMSSKAFRVFNKRTMRVEENLHVEFLENKAIEKGSGPNWLFDIDSLTKSMNYVPVDAGIISTNLSEFPSSKPQNHCSTKVPKDSGNPNPTASTSTPPADQMETLTVETPIPTVSLPIPTAYSTDSQEPSSDARLISKRVANQEETPSLDNILLVAQGHTQEEGIDYDEVFAHVARIEAIRLFLAYASFMGFTVYQMDVKSAFLYGTIDDEVYVMQPPGFQDLEYPARVYKVEKAISDTFYQKAKRDFILVQVYMDDIIFGSSNPQLYREFKALMHEKFQMSAMAQALEFTKLKARVKFLEDRQGEGINLSGDDAPIKGRRLDEEEVATERVSSDNEEIRLDEGEVAAEKVVPTAVAVAPANVSISTSSGVVPTTSTTISTATPIFATATTVTPYTRRKGKEKMVETHTPNKKKRLQKHIDIQFVRELEEELEREAQRMKAQIAKDEEIAKIHAEEELQQMIEGLDRSNKTIAKHLEEYVQAAAELTIRERIELISELVKYQDHHFKILQYQAQQRKTRTKKQKRDFYMADSEKKQKTSKEVPEEAMSPEEVTEEKVKEMMQLVPIEEVYAEALQVKHLTIDWKVYTKGQRSYWNITRLGGSSASYQFFTDLLKHLDREDLNQLMYKPDKEDQLWTHTQNFMHALIDWKLYDSCGVHHVTSKDKEISMLVEKDYPLRKGLALVMIYYKLQVENFSHMANDLVLKIYKIANSPRQQANKKCIVNVEVFRTILDICPRVESVDFTNVPDDDTALTFLIDLGYKGLLNRYTNIFVDHMHQPWITLAAIINKCLSRKTASNDKLRKSRIAILWGMFNRENVDYPELIWEDFAYQIDRRKDKRSRRENMPCPRFTKIIINHFLKQHKSFTNLNHNHYHTIKDDGLVSRLKFVRICEDYQEYKLPIPDVMLIDAIKRSESYQMFIKYSKNQIPLTKSRGEGLKGKKTSSKRRVKKKLTLSAKDNIISNDPDAALELAKSISQTKAEEAEAARKVHPTHARIVTESVPESAKMKSLNKKLQSLCKLLRKVRRQAEDNQVLEAQIKELVVKGVLDESTVMYATSSKGTSAKPRKDDKDGDADDEGDDHVNDTQDANDEDDKTKSNEYDIYKYKICVRKDKDVEMKDAKVEESDKGKDKVTNAAKEEAEKTSEAKDDTKKTKLPPSSSSLDFFAGYSHLTRNFPDPVSISIEVSTAVPSPQVTHIISIVQQTPTPISTPLIITEAPTIIIVVYESNALSAVELRVTKLEKDVSKLKTVDHSSKALVVLQSHVPTVVDSYIDTKVGDGKKTKRRRSKESESSKKPSSTKDTPKGKAPTKGSKTGKSTEVVMDDVGDDVAHEVNQIKDTSEPKTRKTLRDHYPFVLSKPFPLRGPLDHQTIAADYFFNNHLEYLKTSDPEVRKFSKQNVYSTKAILGVKSVSMKKLHGYGYSEEIVVKRSDQQLYKFKEYDFVDLHLNDIEDVLLLALQHKLFNLDENVIVDFIVALCMFTRSLILKRRVEDLKLSELSMRTWTNRKEFCELMSCTSSWMAHSSLSAMRFITEYSTFIWITTRRCQRESGWLLTEKRSSLIIELINKQMREREIIINLERLVSARELEMDYKLMTRTVQSSGPISKSYLVNIVNMCQGGVGGGGNGGVGTATAVVGVMVAVAARGVVSVWRCGEGSGDDVDGGGGVRWWQWGEGGAWEEWRGGSDRSGDGESFWVRRKKPAGKVFRWRPEVAAVVAGRR
nr:hypothetical protein [Tanacetum cinerariifolium]